MFNIELKFAADAVLKWFNMKIKSGNLEIYPKVKTKYEINNPIIWEKDKCCICNFLLHINPKGLEYQDSEMSYTDFLIRKEHKFLRNIYTQGDLLKSENLKDLESYYFAFKKFLNIIIFMKDALKDSVDFNNIIDDDLKKFLMTFCSDYFDDIVGLISEIKQVKIKNTNTKIPKCTLQIYSYVYIRLMDFPKCDLIFEAITTKGFFENIYRITNVKLHLHHSHVTGQIYDYAHDFCNWKVRENQLGFSCIAHSYFGFDFFLFLKL